MKRQFKIPAAPANLEKVTDRNGLVWTKYKHWWMSETCPDEPRTWDELLSISKFLTEYIEPPSEYDLINELYLFPRRETPESLDEKYPDAVERAREICARFKRAYSEVEIEW